MKYAHYLSPELFEAAACSLNRSGPHDTVQWIMHREMYMCTAIVNAAVAVDMNAADAKIAFRALLADFGITSSGDLAYTMANGETDHPYHHGEAGDSQATWERAMAWRFDFLTLLAYAWDDLFFD